MNKINPRKGAPPFQIESPKLQRDPAGRYCPDCAEDLGEDIPLDINGTCHGCGRCHGRQSDATRCSTATHLHRGSRFVKAHCADRKKIMGHALEKT